MIFAVFDPSPLTVCINCSFFTFIPYIGRQVAPVLRRTNGFKYEISNRTLPKLWVGTFFVRSVQSRKKDFELILTVKMETRHPVKPGDHSVVNFLDL